MNLFVGVTILFVVMIIWLIICIANLSIDLWYYLRSQKFEAKKYVVNYMDTVEVLGSNATGVVASKYAEIINNEPYRLVLLNNRKLLYPYLTDMRVLPERLLCLANHRLK